MRNADGGTTLTLRNQRGNIKVENYPPGAMVERVVRERDS